MQMYLASLSQECYTFTRLNPDSSECYKDIALFVLIFMLQIKANSYYII